MNNKEVVQKVSEKSGVALADCQKVIDALEEVLADELTHSKDVKTAFDKVYQLLHFFKKEKR